MALFNGTQVADIISGTVGDDVITGLGGEDVINGAAGNDQINGGADGDNILGGTGDDTITVDSASDLQLDTITGGAPYDIIDGGDDTDTLVSGLRDGDEINQGVGTLWQVAGVSTSNLEFVRVSTASDFLLDLASDAVFGSDLTLTSNDGTASGADTADILGYTASNGEVNATANADGDEGVIIDGVTYMDGDTYMSADGGSVDISFGGGMVMAVTKPAFGQWTFDYTPAEDDLYAVGVSGDPSDDIITTFVATITNQDGNTIDVTVNLALNLDEDFDASASSVGVTSPGDFQDNSINGSEFDDVFFAGGATDSGMDILFGNGGNDTLGGGDDNDALYGGDGNDTIFAGAGDDAAYGGQGDDEVWGGEGNDTIFGDEGNDSIGGGDGDDRLRGNDGDDTLFAGADDGIDNLQGGAGNDTIFAGAGDDARIRGNDGDDTLFNGAGDDTDVRGGDGDDTLWGGAGDDVLTGQADDDTFAFVAGNGNDRIRDFEFGAAPGEGDVLDLTAFGFVDTQAVIDAMSNTGNGGTAVLALAPGQTVEFRGINDLFIADFQAAVDDWVLV